MYRFMFVSGMLVLGTGLSMASSFEQEKGMIRPVFSHAQKGDVIDLTTASSHQEPSLPASDMYVLQHLLERLLKEESKAPLVLINGGRGEVESVLTYAGFDVYVQEKNAALITQGKEAGFYKNRTPKAQSLKEFVALRKEGPRQFSYAVVQDWWELDESNQEVSMKTLASLLKPGATVIFTTALFDYFPNAKVRHVPPYQHLMDDLRVATSQRFETCEEWVLKFPHISQAQIHLTLRRY